MYDLTAEANFFKEVAPQVIKLVADADDWTELAEDKGGGDFSTKVDIAVEEFLAKKIESEFPNDKIMAEETHADVTVADGRIWIIDPICGTSNIGKRINNFCTNIALADGKKLIASCVVDHNRKEFFWSVGQNQLFVDDTPLVIGKTLGTKIDVDLGSMTEASSEIRKRHLRSLERFATDTNYSLVSLNSSLSFAYAAIGKLDGFINVYCHPWDICASSFLIQQVGGVVTAIDGSPWEIDTVGAIAGHTPEIHMKILEIFTSS